ncbi:hypothetical protein OD762_15520 [Pseudomonas aeruginosa]|nr:hypothetical protein [Pseudomonas aeruginosa]MCV4132008.1 hypothetical protein [Pseudomonas aeruginosa]MCV4188127.1 hypothetical protein [Pseudomonas aeruginosa]MCV4360120.1 hypothetical protein [Pseudomonas aeruginosa]MCW3882338.1 hypothetical protein [Pseudomonas aeruginosa]RUJ60399.1 hypothetical protein IPC252_16880 [Pseudomonas aeruginosa]
MKLDQEGACLATRLPPADPLKVILGGRLAWYKANADTDSYKVSERIDTRLNFNNLSGKSCYSGIDFGSLNYGEPRNLMSTVKYRLRHRAAAVPPQARRRCSNIPSNRLSKAGSGARTRSPAAPA